MQEECSLQLHYSGFTTLFKERSRGQDSASEIHLRRVKTGDRNADLSLKLKEPTSGGSLERCSCRPGPIRGSAGLWLSGARVARKPYLCVLCPMQGISLKAAGHLGRGDAA